tara:strand:+ start:1025 stop:1777 length:753 start_codon:yes stop_codon:yes gene_type:complete
MSTKTYGEKVNELILVKELLHLKFRNRTQKEIKEGCVYLEDLFLSIKRGKLKDNFDNVFHFAGSLNARKNDGLLYILGVYEVIPYFGENRKKISFFFKKHTKDKELQLNGITEVSDTKSHKGHKLNKAIDGELLRSKQEVIIYNLLKNEKELTIKYEHKMHSGDSVMYPDFKITFTNKKGVDITVLWEHFGMINHIDYDQSVMKRIDKYIAIDYTFKASDKMLFMSYYNSDEDLVNMTKNYIKEIKKLIG